MKPGRKRQIRIDLETGCHVAQGCVNGQGYAVYKHKGRRHSAARVVWMETHGPIAEGLQVDHLCRNRACVNIEHLELVSAAENVRRSNVAKLTLEEVREIRACGGQGRAVAKRYGVSESLVSMIRSGRIWADDLLKHQRETGG